MSTKKYKSRTPGMRERVILDHTEISANSRQKLLTTKLTKSGGRNNLGRITVRRRGGGNKRLFRLIDFKRDKMNVPGTLKTIEYDPNRNAYIGLVFYKDGEKRYIILPNNLKIGDEIVSGENVDISIGNALSLKNIPDGIIIHNIELTPGKGAQLARSAGSSAVLQAKGKKYASIKLPSGEVRYINLECVAVIGEVATSHYRNTKRGKAGANRWLGKRPKVRGSAMNPCDHPHGGGEGKAPIGLDGPKTPWGKPTLGKKTRRKSNKSDRLRIRLRK